MTYWSSSPSHPEAHTTRHSSLDKGHHLAHLLVACSKLREDLVVHLLDRLLGQMTEGKRLSKKTNDERNARQQKTKRKFSHTGIWGLG